MRCGPFLAARCSRSGFRLQDATCQLNSPSGKLKHVVYIEFDNQHFTRDNPNVPSDLEQKPNLLNFIEQNGTLKPAITRSSSHIPQTTS